MATRMVDDGGKVFSPQENGVSIIEEKNIVEVINREPKTVRTADRLKYVFPEPVNVDEMGGR